MLFLAATIVSVSGVFIAGGWSDIEVCSFGKPFIHSFIHLFICSFINHDDACLSLPSSSDLFLLLQITNPEFEDIYKFAVDDLPYLSKTNNLVQNMTQSNNETLEICSAQEQVRIESKRKRAHVCVCVCLFVQYCIFVTLLIFCCIIFFCAQVVAGMNFFLSFSPNCTDSDIIRYASQTHYNPFFLSLSFFFILSDCSSPRSSFLHCVLPSGKT